MGCGASSDAAAADGWAANSAAVVPAAAQPSPPHREVHGASIEQSSETPGPMSATGSCLSVILPDGMAAGTVLQIDGERLGAEHIYGYFATVPAGVAPGQTFTTIVGGGAHAFLEDAVALQPLVAELTDGMGYERLASESALARAPGAGNSKLEAAVELLLDDDFMAHISREVQEVQWLANNGGLSAAPLPEPEPEPELQLESPQSPQREFLGQLAASVADRPTEPEDAAERRGRVPQQLRDPLHGVTASERVEMALECAQSAVDARQEVVQVLALVLARVEEVKGVMAQQRHDLPRLLSRDRNELEDAARAGRDYSTEKGLVDAMLGQIQSLIEQKSRRDLEIGPEELREYAASSGVPAERIGASSDAELKAELTKQIVEYFLSEAHTLSQNPAWRKCPLSLVPRSVKIMGAALAMVRSAPAGEAAPEPADAVRAAEPVLPETEASAPLLAGADECAAHPHQDPEQWQHAAIDAARDGDWKRLESLVLPQGHARMPDELLNGIPSPRNFNVLHQMSMVREEGDAGATAALRKLVKAGCRFNLEVQTKPEAGCVFSRKTGAEDHDGANLTARDIAEQWDCPEYLALLDEMKQAQSSTEMLETASDDLLRRRAADELDAAIAESLRVQDETNEALDREEQEMVNAAIELSLSPVLERTTSHLLAMKRHDQAAAFAELQTLASLLEPDDAAAEQAAAELQRHRSGEAELTLHLTEKVSSSALGASLTASLRFCRS